MLIDKMREIVNESSPTEDPIESRPLGKLKHTVRRIRKAGART